LPVIYPRRAKYPYVMAWFQPWGDPMRFRLAALFRWVPGATRAAFLRNARHRIYLLLICSGLGVLAALAPFGIARMRFPAPFDGPEAEPPETTPTPLRTPEEASCEMLQERFRVLVDGKVDTLEKNYDIESDTGRWSWEKESTRSEYLTEWAKDRGLKVVEAKARIEVDAVTPDGPDAVWVEITEHALYTYVPDPDRKQDGDGEPVWTHTFGSRAVHVLELALRGGDWKIRRDWYADPIGHESYLPPCKYGVEPEAADPPGPIGTSRPEPQDDPLNRRGQYDRDAALEYAVKHAGVPALEGSGKYNPNYRVYTFVGGDCANFASQVLQAGGLEQGYGWHYTSEGSASWVRSEDLVWHLLSTGRAKRIYTGDFAGAVRRTPEHPAGIIGEMEPGDIIAYELKGEICHVAVVVGKDPSGYVTIASHTSDRLFFPWDMGWNDNTVFWLIKIVY